MAATRQDLITTVLENLGVLAAGQSASVEDREVVNRRVDPKLAELARREVFAGLSADALDPAVFLFVADVVAYACRTPFGITGAKADELKAKADQGEAELRGMARQFDAGTATSGLFDPVQATLEMLGIVAAGQTASDQDRCVVLARVQPLLLELYGRDICGVTDLSLLSTELQRAFTRCLAADLALSFTAVPADRVVMLMQLVPAAEGVLRYQSFVYDARPPLRVDAFWGRRCARPFSGAV